jgi:hypothetical protein
VEKNVSERLPKAQGGNEAKGNEAEPVIEPGGVAGREEKLEERLHHKDGGADNDDESYARRKEAAPVKAYAGSTDPAGHPSKCTATEGARSKASGADFRWNQSSFLRAK